MLGRVAANHSHRRTCLNAWHVLQFNCGTYYSSTVAERPTDRGSQWRERGGGEEGRQQGQGRRGSRGGRPIAGLASTLRSKAGPHTSTQLHTLPHCHTSTPPLTTPPASTHALWGGAMKTRPLSWRATQQGHPRCSAEAPVL
eukprot:365429-Chlamydomonas_euryale.AAC.4